MMKRVIVAYHTEELDNSLFYQDMCKIIGPNSTTSRIPILADDLDFFNFKCDSPLPTDLSKPLSFAECCDKRAVEILKESLTNSIVITWSGGIDSTCIIVALLKNGFDKKKHNITISCNNNSVYEYKAFFWMFVLPLFNVKKYNTHGDHDKNILYSGDLGDQLFGSHIIFSMIPKYGPEIITKPYADTILTYFKSIDEQAGLKIFNHYHPIVDHCPFPIVTAFDFLWWWNFSQKWQHCKHRQLMWGAAENLKHHANNRAFFDTDYFQVWSMTNHDKKISGGSLITYKMTAKEYIIDYTKDKKYINKLKYSSVTTKESSMSAIMLDANFKPIIDNKLYKNSNRKS